MEKSLGLALLVKPSLSFLNRLKQWADSSALFAVYSYIGPGAWLDRSVTLLGGVGGTAPVVKVSLLDQLIGGRCLGFFTPGG